MDIHTETINDLPIIDSLISGCELDKQIDAIYPRPKNWKGLSIGKVMRIWIIYILSSCDHRLSHVEDWALNHLGILNTLIDDKIRREDFCDDKLGLILEYLSDGKKWNDFLGNYNRNAIRVYDLKDDIYRIDATIGKSFKQVIEDGLFQMGNSKHFRPDLAQFKMMLSTLDPVGFPLVSLIVSGEHADDPLYIPVIKQSIQCTGATYKLFVGDCKMSSIETRTFIENSENYYLSPLSRVQMPSEKLCEYLAQLSEDQYELKYVYKQGKKIAKGFELTVPITVPYQGKTISWTERRLVVRSYKYANSQIKSLVTKATKAYNDLQALTIRKQGKKVYTTEYELDTACEDIIKKHKVKGIVEYNILREKTSKQIRGYKNKPAREETVITLTVEVTINETELEKRKKTLGWRVYATNSPSDKFTLEAAVLIYRNEYIIENCFNTLKNKPLNLLPIFLHKDERIIGLINLLTLALSIIRLIEYKVHRGLAESKKGIKGLYAGNPQKTTSTPTAHLLLKAFNNKYCTIITENQQQDKTINTTKKTEVKKDDISTPTLNIQNTKKQYNCSSKVVLNKIFVTPLTMLQITILRLLGLSPEVYTDLEKDFICPYKIIESRYLYNTEREENKQLKLSQELGEVFDFNNST